MISDEANAASTLDRVRGALLGVHAGDSLGATLEFRSWAEIRAAHPGGHRDITGGGPFRWDAGAATDDTDLTRAILLAYVDHLASGDDPGDDVTAAAAARMVEWFTGNWPGRIAGSTPRDVGGATATGLRAFVRSGDFRSSGAGQGSAGNGSLMRCIATGLVRRSHRAIVDESTALSAVTHDDVRCTVACAAYNTAVSALVDGAMADQAVAAAVETARELGNAPVEAAIGLGATLDLASMAATGENTLPNQGRGYVLDSLAIAVAALLDLRSIEDVLVDVVALGHDTDTNGAVAGGLRGALDGASAIPTRWVGRLQFGDEFLRYADMLAAHRA